MEINNQCEDDFSEQILADLVSQGFSGDELSEKFKEQSMKVRPAVKSSLQRRIIWPQAIMEKRC
ncbi:hypothetical protein A7X67_13295 [Clostridium sp. W14A]|nr:hypothetical protein A7X67_13295 [Clostridium sp. W14A]